jgi:hypothetical protein
MRRLCVTLAFAALSLSLFPARADAYIWAWLDDLSGPWFGGTVVEWRVYCRSESIEEDQRVLVALRGTYADLLQGYKKKAGDNDTGARYYESAGRYMNAAIVYLDYAITELDSDPNADVSRLLAEVHIWQHHAKEHAAWAALLEKPGGAKEGLPPSEPQAPEPTEFQKSMLVTAGFGVTLSLCDSKPGRRDTQFLAVNAGYAFDVKKSNRDFGHRMVTIGASYNLIVSPSVSLGAGAGLATFSSKTGDTFRKMYLQPIIVDFRPFLLSKKRQGGSPWNHVLYFRGSVLTFPAGFEPGRFGRQTERFEAELTPTFGIHFDFSPVIKDMQGKYRRRQPAS